MGKPRTGPLVAYWATKFLLHGTMFRAIPNGTIKILFRRKEDLWSATTLHLWRINRRQSRIPSKQAIPCACAMGHSRMGPSEEYSSIKFLSHGTMFRATRNGIIKISFQWKRHLQSAAPLQRKIK